MENISIEMAIPVHAVDIVAVRLAACLQAYPNKKHNITENDIAANNGPERVEKWKAYLAQKTCCCWVAKKDGKIIGIIRAEKGDEINKVAGLHVLPEYQGAGLGRQLMQQALDYVGTDKTIQFDVVSYNEKAINWYKRMGFRETGNKKWKMETGKFFPITVMTR